jgi:hypothetical protein
VLTFSSHDLHFLEKLMYQKDWVHLTSGRSLRLKIRKNWVSYSAELNQNKGDSLENPQNQLKTSPSP